MNFLALLALLFAALALPAQAGLRTASIGVSAIVMSSCRVNVSSQLDARSAAQRLKHSGECSGDARPATKATVETQPMSLVANIPMRIAETLVASGSDGRAWVRYDVDY